MSVHLNLSEDPIKVSLLSIVVSFILSIIFLMAVKPKFVVTPETKKLQQKKVDTKLLLIYSGLFSVFIGIIALLWRSSQYKKTKYTGTLGTFSRPFGQRMSPQTSAYKQPFSYGHKKYSYGNKGYGMGNKYMYGAKKSCGCG